MSLTRCLKELMNNIISGHITTKKLNCGKVIEASSFGFLFVLFLAMPTKQHSGLNPCPQQWKLRIPITGHLGKSLALLFFGCSGSHFRDMQDLHWDMGESSSLTRLPALGVQSQLLDRQGGPCGPWIWAVRKLKMNGWLVHPLRGRSLSLLEWLIPQQTRRKQKPGTGQGQRC